nr:NifU family protein [Sedimentibacter sp.]
MIEKIEHVLDEYVRPKLSEHYGNVQIMDFKDGVLKIKLEGQCSNCPSARFTVEDVIEIEVKKHVPEVEKIVLIEGVSDELLAFASKILNKKL